jgi:hypothetical protein
MMKLRHVLPLLLTVLVGPAVSGCLHLHASAKTVSDSPPLDTPAAPPRAIEVVEVTPPAPVLLVEEPPRQPIRPLPRPQPRAEAPPPRAQEPPKVEVRATAAVVEAPPQASGNLTNDPAGTEGKWNVSFAA